MYGTLSSPVHATNLESILSEIYFRHSKPFCIAVDASLGTQGHIGYVTVGTGPLKPGLGVNKQLPDVGDLHITGIVNLSGTNDPMLLQTTRLNVVMELADIIVTGLLYCLDPIHSVQKPHFYYNDRHGCSRNRAAPCLELANHNKRTRSRSIGGIGQL